MRHPTRALPFVALALLAAGCGEVTTAPSTALSPPSQAAASTVKFWEVGASAAWNEQATLWMASLPPARPLNAIRVYAYLSMAQFRAAEAAEAITPHPPTSAAIGAASAHVLRSLIPEFASAIDAALQAQSVAEPWPGAKHENFAVGAAIGHAIGARVVAYAASDRVFPGAGAANPGLPPVGPGYFLFDGRPIARGGYGARAFYLSSDDEFRSPPPPAFGSPAYFAALAEVRQISDNRSPEQIRIANYWNVNQSPRSNAAMNGKAVELIRRYRRQDAEAARILFLVNSAAFDAAIGCFDAKFAYWYIRPNQADLGIRTVFPTPPHPAYPSAHSCFSGSITGVLSATFPNETDQLTAFAEEASLSRLYAGIHYRFDMDAGLALGRAVAAKAMAADLDHDALLP